MEIRGQFKLKRLSERNTLKLNLFMNMRRCKYDMSLLVPSRALGLSLRDNTLWGEYGDDGEFLIPSVKHHKKMLELGMEPYNSDCTRMFEEELCRQMICADDMLPLKNYSVPSGPQLYFDYRVYSPEGDKYSYLAWAGGDKSSFTVQTFEYLDGILRRMKSRIIDGRMARFDYGDLEVISAEMCGFMYGRRSAARLQKGDYTLYLPGVEPAKSRFAVSWYVAAVRNTEVFTGTESELEDERIRQDDTNWASWGMPLYLGVFGAYDCYGARQAAADKYGKPMEHLIAEEVY